MEESDRKQNTFEEVYIKLEDSCRKLEDARLVYINKAKRNMTLFGSITFVAVMVFLLFFVQPWHIGWFLITSSVLAAIVCAFVAATPREYVKQYKSEVIAALVENVVENGKYHPESSVKRDVFIKSGLFETPDRYSSEDVVAGRVGKTDISFGEVHAEKRTRHTDSKGNTTEKWSDIFRGILFFGDFNKHFNGHTIVTRNFFIKDLEFNFRSVYNWGGNSDRKRCERVKLENVEFEKKFKTFSTDQIEARYILSPNLMERMLTLNQAFEKGKISFSFFDSFVVVAISNSIDHFETNIWQRADKKEILKREYDMLCSMVSIVEELNLNTRIWSKK